MFMLTQQAVDHIREMLAETPLEPDELRRIVGMGAMYISKSDAHPEPYRRFFTITIDDVTYHVFGRL